MKTFKLQTARMYSGLKNINNFGEYLLKENLRDMNNEDR